MALWRSLGFCTVVLAFALGLAGQQDKPKPQAAPPEDPAQTAFRLAGASVADVPVEVQPQDYLEIAKGEAIRHPDLARTDDVRGFHAALDLAPARSDDDAVGAWHFAIKSNTELSIISQLTFNSANFEVAHQLARLADIPHSRLYTELIASAATAAQQKAGGQFPAEQQLLAETFGGVGYTPKTGIKAPTAVQPDYDVLALARECYQADGSFPYLGVVIALSAYHRTDQDQKPLALAAANAAQGETSLFGMIDAARSLPRIHAIYPALDTQLETAAIALLGHMRQAVQSPPTGGTPAHQQYEQMLVDSNREAGGRLLQFLSQIDSDRAAELGSEFSLFASDLPQPHGTPISALTAPQRQANRDPATALGNLRAMPTISDAEKDAKFLALTNLAITLAEKNPKPAADAASQALDLMTDDMLAAHMERVALLALRLGTDLNQATAAHALMLRCLDAAEATAAAKQQAFENASPSDQRSLAEDFNGVGAPEVELFAYAAQLDFPLALQRAIQTSATDFKPIFLERVGAGEEMKHPWWE